LSALTVDTVFFVGDYTSLRVRAIANLTKRQWSATAGTRRNVEADPGSMRTTHKSKALTERD
jgi:hypothetical protein